MRTLTLSLLMMLASASAFGAAPMLGELEPRGGQQGTPVKLTLIGSGLTDETEVISAIPGALTPLSPPQEMERRGRELPFLLEIREDAPVGVYPVRVRNPDGLSNVLLFSVGAFPELAEEESLQETAGLPPQPISYDAVSEAPASSFQEAQNDTAEGAQKVPLPVTVNGTLPGPDRDYFRFSANAGEKLVVEVESRRIGSAIDPRIEVFDSSGERLARNDDAGGIGVDARLEVKFPKDGDYFVAVQDSKFSIQQKAFYRLKIGRYAFAEGLFPLGWERGSEVEVELFGGNLPRPVKVRPDLSPQDEAAEFALIPVPGEPGALPLRLLLGDGPEMLEPPTDEVIALTPGTLVNGRISKAGETDRYKLAVKPGEKWQIQMQAAKLGSSSLYGIMTLRDDKGEKLASTSDTGLRFKLSTLDLAEDSDADQHVAFEVPDGVNEIRVDVEDLLGRGGPDFGYRLVASKQGADFSLTLRTNEVNIPLGGTALVLVSAERKGYDGPIDLLIPNLPADLEMDGGHIPLYELQGSRQAASLGFFTLTPKPGATRRPLNLEVWGEAVIDGQTVRRRARGPGMETNVAGEKERLLQIVGFSANVAPWLGVDLPAMIVDPRPAVLEVASPRKIRLIQGMKTELAWAFVPRRKDVPPPERFDRGNLRLSSNVRATTRNEQAKDQDFQGTMVLGTQVGWGPGQFDGVFTAEAEIDGRKETFYTPAVTIDVVRAFEIEPATEITVLEPGQDRELLATVKREPGFSSPVEVTPQNLPLGIACEPATVAAGSEELRVRCRAESDAPPGEYEIDLSSSSKVLGGDDKEIPFTLPPFQTRVRIAGGEVRAAK